MPKRFDKDIEQLRHAPSSKRLELLSAQVIRMAEEVMETAAQLAEEEQHHDEQ